MVAITDTATIGPPVFIWDVSYNVGPHCPNCMDDTALIQTLLNGVVPSLNILDPNNPIPGTINPVTMTPLDAPLGALTVDGFWGPKTNEAIVLYQQAMGYVDNQTGLVQPVGPITDPLNSGLVALARTIWSLNVNFLKYQGRMLDVPDLPPAFQPYFNKVS